MTQPARTTIGAATATTAEDASSGQNSTDRRNELQEERTRKYQTLQTLNKKNEEVQKQRGLVENLKKEQKERVEELKKQMKERREQDLHRVEHLHQVEDRNHTGRIVEKHQAKRGAMTDPNHAGEETRAKHREDDGKGESKVHDTKGNDDRRYYLLVDPRPGEAPRQGLQHTVVM